MQKSKSLHSTQLYERMRTSAVVGSRRSKNKNSFGQAHLQSKGVLAWVNSCDAFYGDEPIAEPIQWGMKESLPEIDSRDQVKNIVTMMVLNYLRGAQDGCRN